MNIYGVIGWPVKHSLSPAMHNAAFKELGIEAEYKLFEVRPEDLGNFIHSISKESICGLNVTIPYKEIVITFLDKISSEAGLIGAVNTVKVSDNKLEGYNTDGEGFLRHLTEDLGFKPEGKNIAIIGAGGAARAVSVYLGKEKPKRISIYDIDKARLEALFGHLKENFNNIEFKSANSIEELDIEDCSLLINATPIGMKASDPCLVDGKFIHKGILVYDLIYNPKETKLLELGKQKGAVVSNGLGMLLYQGAAAFELWTDKKAPIEIMREALREGVDKI